MTCQCSLRNVYNPILVTWIKKPENHIQTSQAEGCIHMSWPLDTSNLSLVLGLERSKIWDPRQHRFCRITSLCHKYWQSAKCMSWAFLFPKNTDITQPPMSMLQCHGHKPTNWLQSEESAIFVRRKLTQRVRKVLRPSHSLEQLSRDEHNGLSRSIRPVWQIIWQICEMAALAYKKVMISE